MTDYDRATLLWRDFAIQLRRKAAELEKSMNSTHAAVRVEVYREIAELALTVSKGQTL